MNIWREIDELRDDEFRDSNKMYFNEGGGVSNLIYFERFPASTTWPIWKNCKP